MHEGYRPLEEEIQQPRAETSRGELTPIPESINEAIAMQRETIEHEMVHDFGIPEVPKQILAEMEHVLRTIDAHVREKGYADECEDGVIDQMRQLAIKISHFKDDPDHIAIKSVPEQGLSVSFRSDAGMVLDRAFTEDELDLSFQLELWAEQINALKNVDAFNASKKAFETRAQTKPEAEREAYVLDQMQKKYSTFGFSPEQIKNLLLISQTGDVAEFSADGKPGAIEKLKIMKEIWDQYLSVEEKSRYVKMAAGLTAVGAVEGVMPSLIGMSIDSPVAKMAALFALGYFGAQMASSWVRKKLSIDFDSLVQGIMQKQDGLNQQLSRDLAFQPGERMSKGENRGKIMDSFMRSQSAFKEILYSVARVQAPAIASTTVGLGMMFVNDWKLGLISFLSAPIAMAISRKNDRKQGPIIEASHQNQQKIGQEIFDQLLAHQDIALAGTREEMAHRIETLASDRGRIQHERVGAYQEMDFSSSVLRAGVFGALTTAGVALREMGLQAGGSIVAALVYSGMFRENFDQIVRTNSELFDSFISIAQMEEVFNGYAQAEVEADHDRVGVSELKDFSVRVEHLSKEMDGEKILDDVSFSVPAGGIVRLEGKSGHGKTTLARLMSGYYDPTSGSVSLGDQAITHIKKTGLESLYTRLAYLSQAPNIFDGESVKANLMFGNPQTNEDEMKNVLQQLGLSDRFSKNGRWDLDQKPRGLSGGEKARLGLARVLLKIRSQTSGGMVFLDQATEELDAQTEAEVARILLEEKRKRASTTFVIISHRDDFIRAFEHPSDGTEGISIQRVKLEKGKLVT